MLRLVAVVVALLLLVPVGSPPSDAAPRNLTGTPQHRHVHRPTPFLAVDRVHTKVPRGVLPWDPTFSPDGKHILFQDYRHDREWLADGRGRHVRCLDCSFEDRPRVIPGFTYVFPDNKRMFLANELGDLAYVLECAPSLYACTTHHWLPIDLSGDANTLQLNLGRRTFHLAPDGVHVGYTITRPDGLVMMVAALKRTPSTYRLVDYKVVNPSPPSGLADTDPAGWANAGSLDELKSFADGGRSILAVVQTTAGNVDQVKIDLATGHVTRLTTDPDWDEDGALAPDSRSLLVESWRTMHRLTPFGLFRGSRPFVTLPVGAAIAIHYVSSQAGFACDLQPWLLPARGDSATTIGQPLNPYAGHGPVIGGNDLAGQSVWSPDSTRVLVQERLLGAVPAGADDYLKQKGSTPSRLTVAVIHRRPTRPVKPVRTRVGAWAPTPQEYAGVFGSARAGVVRGRFGGTATITIGGNLAAGTSSVVYSGFSDDRGVLVDGVVNETGGPTLALHYTSQLTATDVAGHRIGSEDIDVTFRSKQPAPPAGQVPSTISGHATATWRGVTASGLPRVSPCPASMATPAPLGVRLHRRGHRVAVTVTATIGGHTNPVQGALVSARGSHARTDRHGRALLHGVARNAVVRADAGDTFVSARRRVR